MVSELVLRAFTPACRSGGYEQTAPPLEYDDIGSPRGLHRRSLPLQSSRQIELQRGPTAALQRGMNGYQDQHHRRFSFDDRYLDADEYAGGYGQYANGSTEWQYSAKQVPAGGGHDDRDRRSYQYTY